ncbi:hypothetical protein ISN44_As07g009920 [Arabidopsis suecica]|uniref:Uncharacterized protein n=1 Tax=Arabidopsis suecica TaxID=45249 RepID=A0A8T2BRN8_ARASU|nr:hypothetical protein ISN44_As07g009920 [Arabidopsis suecica]
MVASDHSPVIATLADKAPRGKRNFRFDKRWIGKEGLLEAISNGWNLDSEPGDGKFVEKLSNCRRAISQWRRDLTPYGRQTIEELKSELNVAQRDDRRSREEITDLTMRLKEAYRDEELYWHQKSRSSWMQLGDNNSKYFHALTKQRRARNRITGLHDENGIWSTEDKDVQSIVVSYFKDLFTTTKPEAFEEALAEVQLLITEQINEFLTAPATESEVRATLFMMHPEKAPGPDDVEATAGHRSGSDGGDGKKKCVCSPSKHPRSFKFPLRDISVAYRSSTHTLVAEDIVAKTALSLKNALLLAWNEDSFVLQLFLDSKFIVKPFKSLEVTVELGRILLVLSFLHFRFIPLFFALISCTAFVFAVRSVLSAVFYSCNGG